MAKQGRKILIKIIIFIVLVILIMITFKYYLALKSKKIISEESIQETKSISYTYNKLNKTNQSEVYVLIKEESKKENQDEIPIIEENVNQKIEATYIKGILLVNKNYELPSDYDPGTNEEALNAFNNMKKEASKNGISLKIVSGYRSYETQAAIFKKNVNLYGEEKANTFSAKPGQSEHQTGLAFDINSTEWAFADTAEGKWLAENCHKFGFIIRYPKGKEELTGYVYEPWHIRYIGISAATEIKNLGVCLEEYLGVI